MAQSKNTLTRDQWTLIQSISRSCGPHASRPDAPAQPDCRDCYRVTRNAQAAMLPLRKSPAPRFKFWYERDTRSNGENRYLDMHYAYGSEGGWGESHTRSGKLGDCPACWNARLSNWIAASAVSMGYEVAA